MDPLGWLVNRRFRQLKRREHHWVLLFDERAYIVIECLWRLLEGDRIKLTSDDDGQQFGLPASVDVEREVSGRLSGASVVSARVQSGTLDLELRFSTGDVFQILPNSAGYEAWTAGDGEREFIAVGGGELTTLARPH